MEEKFKFYGIEVKEENQFFICLEQYLNAQYSRTDLTKYQFDGKHPNPAFIKNWYVLDKKPNKICRETQLPPINHRFELRDPNLTSDKIPLKLLTDEVLSPEAIENRQFHSEWEGQFSTLRPLYELKYEYPDPIFQELEFEFIKIFSVDKIIQDEVFEYKIPIDPQWNHKGKRNVNKDDIKYSLIERLLFPEILLSQRPCEFDSVTVYRIVREYIRDNIDPKVAKISSDYNFCFEVQKRIKLCKPKERMIDVSRTKKPKYELKVDHERNESCFRMTNKKENYDNYPAIEGIRAKNQKELNEKMQKYLDELISFINEPIIECPVAAEEEF